MLHYVYLINRFQLHNKSNAMMEKLRKVSEELGRDYEFVVNDTPEQAHKALAGFRDKDYVITAIGGDGSINHVLNAIVGTRNILAFIPHGTGNDFYRTCIESLENGIHEVDLIRVNDRYCINVACFGIDADIANDDILKMKKARHLDSPDLKIYETDRLVVSSAVPFKANIDGEPLLGDRFELEMVPRAIRLDFNRDLIRKCRD